MIVMCRGHGYADDDDSCHDDDDQTEETALQNRVMHEIRAEFSRLADSMFQELLLNECNARHIPPIDCESPQYLVKTAAHVAMDAFVAVLPCLFAVRTHGLYLDLPPSKTRYG